MKSNDTKKTILILDGASETGQLIAAFLLRETRVRILLADQNINSVRDLAAEFNSVVNGKRTDYIVADTQSPSLLEQVFQQADLIIAPQTSNHTAAITSAVHKTGVDLLRVNTASHAMETVQTTHQNDKASNCLILNHPSTPFQGDPNQEIIVQHDDDAVLTAASATACVKQYLNEDYHLPGVLHPEDFMNADQYFDDLKNMGAYVIVQQVAEFS